MRQSITQLNNRQKIEGGKRCKGIAKSENEDSPFISIITAAYNANATIERTIKSILDQKYTNFEYIIIDGCSTDGTIDTIKRYDELIDYWVSEPDKGIYDALNKGIDLALGEWLYFIGANDRLASDDVLSSIFTKPPKSKMIYGNVIWGNTGRIYDGEFSKRKLFYNNICQQSIFYHRDLFSKLGKFELKYPILADWFFNMQAFSEKDTHPVFINCIVALYSEGGMSTANVDNIFYHDHEKIIKETFGLWNFLYFRSYNIWKELMSFLGLLK